MFERIEEYARKYSLAVGSSESADDNVSLDELVNRPSLHYVHEICFGLKRPWFASLTVGRIT